MSNPLALPRQIGATVLATLSLALVAFALQPSGASAAEGPPSLLMSPVSFGPTTVLTESAPVEVDVVNEGGEEAITEGPHIEGPAEGEFKIVNNECAKVQPGEHCTIKVSFAPQSEPGEKEATLVLPSSNAPTVSTPLNATAVLAELSFEPDPLDFGIVRTNQGESRNVNVVNSGEASVHIDWSGFGGPDSGNFWNGSNTCGGTTLGVGQSCYIQVNFNPWEMREYEALLELHAGPQTFNLTLEGTGGNVVLEPSSNPVALGTATVGSKGPLQAITLTNVGNLPGSFFIAVIAGGDSASFQLVTETCTFVMISPGESCQVNVRFTPQSAGPKSAHLAMFGEGEGGTLVGLDAEGIAPLVSLTPSSFDFGASAVGLRTVPHAFAVANGGTSPLELGSVSIVGTDLGQFALTGDACTDAVLAPGQECQVQVRFAPESAGAKNARLRISGPAGTVTSALSGLGQGSGSGGPSSRGGAKHKHRGHRHKRFLRNATLIAPAVHARR